MLARTPDKTERTRHASHISQKKQTDGSGWNFDEAKQQSGVSSCVNSYGGEVGMSAQHIIKASTVDTLKFLNDESFELRG
jgi:hypothetical protein